MSAHGFRSVFMVASCAGAALGCYLVSLRVASERAALEDVETKIVLAQRDLRLLQTEIGTRGRLAQLERWNVKVLALSAPSADQFLNGGFELAKLTAPQRAIELDAPVVLASASTDTPKPTIEGMEPEGDRAPDLSPRQIMHVASLTRDVPREQPRPVVSLKPSKPSAEKQAESKVLAPKPVTQKASDTKPRAAKAQSAKSSQIAAVKADPIKARKLAAPPKAVAEADPLAPLAVPAKPKKVASSTSRDPAQKQ